jgi:hypothetical protein
MMPITRLRDVVFLVGGGAKSLRFVSEEPRCAEGRTEKLNVFATRCEWKSFFGSACKIRALDRPITDVECLC